jgi:hypothetical protein
MKLLAVIELTVGDVGLLFGGFCLAGGNNITFVRLFIVAHVRPSMTTENLSKEDLSKRSERVLVVIALSLLTLIMCLGSLAFR